MVDFEGLSLSCLKKYRTQYQIRIKPTVPKSELAAAISEHFASIPIPEEENTIHEFLKALQKNRININSTATATPQDTDSGSPLSTNTPPMSGGKTKTATLMEKQSIRSDSGKKNNEKDSSNNNINNNLKNIPQSNSKKVVKKEKVTPSTSSSSSIRFSFFLLMFIKLYF